MTTVVSKRAIDLQPGDLCVGPSIDFTERGTVKSTTVVDRGVQINWEGGMYTIRPEDYLIDVMES
jgi:hypothetical protein